jgi:hypothetical protein
MGCISAKDLEALKNTDFKKLATNLQNLYEGKYQEPSQVACKAVEEATGLTGVDYKLFLEALDAGSDVAGIIEKINLKDEAEKPESKLKDFLGAVSDKQDRILAALLLCKGDSTEKATRLYKEIAGDESTDPVDGMKIHDTLMKCMNIAVKTVPKLAGGDNEKDYQVDVKDYVRNWYRGTFLDTVKKDVVIKWATGGKFTTAEARDSCLRALIDECPKRDASEKDREESAMAGGIAAAQGAAAGPKKKKKYRNGFDVSCQYFEEDFGLEKVPFAKLIDSAEYYKTPGKGAWNEEQMLKVWDKAGGKETYANSKETKIQDVLKKIHKEFIDRGSGDFYYYIQMFALLYCPGELADKFKAFISIVNKRDDMRPTINGKDLFDVLSDAVFYAGLIIPSFVTGGTALSNEWLLIDHMKCTKIWWNGKEEEAPAKVKYDDLKKWFVDDAKFDPREARMVIINIINPPKAEKKDGA